MGDKNSPQQTLMSSSAGMLYVYSYHQHSIYNINPNRGQDSTHDEI